MSKLLVLLVFAGVVLALDDRDYESGEIFPDHEDGIDLEQPEVEFAESNNPKRFLRVSGRDSMVRKSPVYPNNENNMVYGVRRVDLGTDLSGVDTNDHLIRGEADEEAEMKLIRPSVNSYGKLKYQSLPIVENNLVNEFARRILSNQGYKQMLGNPTEEDLKKYLREMFKKASQKTIREQILWKLLGIKAYHNHYIKPLTNDEQKQKVIDFIVKLIQSKTDEDLSGKKTVDLSKHFDRLIYLLNDPEVAAKFQTLLDSFTPTTTTPAPTTPLPTTAPPVTAAQTTVAPTTPAQLIVQTTVTAAPAGNIAPITGVPV